MSKWSQQMHSKTLRALNSEGFWIGEFSGAAVGMLHSGVRIVKWCGKVGN